MKSKYTFVFNQDLEDLLDNIIAKLKNAVEKSDIRNLLQFIVFGGGYGRGEGGIFVSQKDVRLYNDLDFFVLAHDNASDEDLKNIDSFFAILSQELSEIAKIDVDFSKSVRTNYASARMDIMSWREMALCKNVIWGDVERFTKIFLLNSDKTEVLPSEIMKLAMNRFSGLLYAKQRLSQKLELSDDDADFIARNINKALFASGDIYLANAQKMPFKITDRLAEIEGGKYPQEIKKAYVIATGFKALPKIHSSKSDYECQLTNAFELLKKAYFENIKYLKKRTFTRRIKDFLSCVKLFKDFAKFKKNVLFASPQATLLQIAIDLIANSKTSDKSSVEVYTNIWNKLS